MRIGKMDTKITISVRREIGYGSDDWSELTGCTVGYEDVLNCWANVTYDTGAKIFGDRAVGTSTGDTTFVIRNPRLTLTKDHYITANDVKYKVDGVRPYDSRLRFFIIDTMFVGPDDVETEQIEEQWE